MGMHGKKGTQVLIMKKCIRQSNKHIYLWILLDQNVKVQILGHPEPIAGRPPPHRVRHATLRHQVKGVGWW
jgi:hypothetical protein